MGGCSTLVALSRGFRMIVVVMFFRAPILGYP